MFLTIIEYRTVTPLLITRDTGADAIAVGREYFERYETVKRFTVHKLSNGRYYDVVFESDAR